MITKKELNEVRFEMFSKGLYNINEKDVKKYIAKKNAKHNMRRIAKLFGFASISAYMLLFNTGSVVIADTTQNPSETITSTNKDTFKPEPIYITCKTNEGTILRNHIYAGTVYGRYKNDSHSFVKNAGGSVPEVIGDYVLNGGYTPQYIYDGGAYQEFVLTYHKYGTRSTDKEVYGKYFNDVSHVTRKTNSVSHETHKRLSEMTVPEARRYYNKHGWQNIAYEANFVQRSKASLMNFARNEPDNYSKFCALGLITPSNQNYVNSHINQNSQKTNSSKNRTPREVNHKTNSHKKGVSHETKSPSSVDTKETYTPESKSKERENFTFNAICASILIGAIGLIYKGVAMLRK